MIVGIFLILNNGIIKVNKVKFGIVCNMLVIVMIILVILGKCVKIIFNGIVIVILSVIVKNEI